MLGVQIIDDEPIIRKGLTKMIDWEELGFEVTCIAQNGKQALEQLEVEKVDIIITDIEMPIMNGLEFISHIRKEENSIGVNKEIRDTEFNHEHKQMLNPYITEQNNSRDTIKVQENIPDEDSIDSSKAQGILPTDYRIVGQIFKTYWIIQYHEKVFIIDQHAAHERVLYEQFMKEFREHKISRQMLLIPETINLTPSEKLILETNNNVFDALGFGYEMFGENAVVIREVPYILNEPISAAVFKDVLDRIEEERLNNITDIKAERIIRMSCRSAIKAHDLISEKECHRLIGELLALDNPFTCPHGRPTLVSLTQSDIEKMFKRI